MNRWPHGYAYEYNSLWDPFWLEGGETPCEVARKTFGRIAIANADAGAYAYTDEAINQAWRAVGELKRARRASLLRNSSIRESAGLFSEGIADLRAKGDRPRRRGKP